MEEGGDKMGTKSPNRIINGSRPRKGAGSPNVNPKVIKDKEKPFKNRPPKQPKVPTLRDKIKQFQRPQKEEDRRKGFFLAQKLPGLIDNFFAAGKHSLGFAGLSSIISVEGVSLYNSGI